MTKILLAANTDWYLYNFRFSLIHMLKNQGYELVLVTPPGKFTSYFQENGFRWIPWNVKRQSTAPWSELNAILALRRIFRQEQPQLVHNHTIKSVLYGSIAARLNRMPNVVNSITGRGYVFLSNEAKAERLKLLAKPLYRLAFGNPNFAAIFENDGDRQYFIQENLVRSERTWLITGVGVDINRFSLQPESAGIPVILYSGRMLWDKGVGVLVDAVKILHQQNISARLVLVGEPDPGNPASIPSSQIDSWVKDGLAEWWGWQSDMNTIYGRSNLVALPTTYGEGVPTVLLEAAACGRAIVASDIPGCREIVQDGVNGVLISPGNPVSLAEALGKLVTDPGQRGRMGLAGRRLVEEKFTVDMVNEATLAVYQSVLGPGGGTQSKMNSKYD